MIVFDLRCTHAHVFEAWFGSSSAFDDQKGRGLLICPLCGDSNIEKAPMAARLPAKTNTRVEAPVALAKSDSKTPERMKTALAELARVQGEMLKSSKWVGRDFDDQARAMDAGEIDRATIHGEVSPAEAKALIEDGIGVLPLPFPVIPPDKRN